MKRVLSKFRSTRGAKLRLIAVSLSWTLVVGQWGRASNIPRELAISLLVGTLIAVLSAQVGERDRSLPPTQARGEQRSFQRNLAWDHLGAVLVFSTVWAFNKWRHYPPSLPSYWFGLALIGFAYLARKGGALDPTTQVDRIALKQQGRAVSEELSHTVEKNK
ncbi:hypothetical protein [Labedaea rhizosphaerae]|uniref:hypothetical protein n=1 Tax=Labedaea rhizosphaerae TaxID=598644 RepID=UPI001061E91D|nr:hypothetical protein [Labedaea rhizosphaerae]